MAVKRASKATNVDFIDWDALAKERAAVVCTVLEYEDEEDFGNGVVEPVRARVIILTGSKAGQVYDNERILKAGIRQKLNVVQTDDDGNEVQVVGIGDDVVGRLEFYGKRNHVGLNAEDDGDVELAEKALAKLSTNGSKSAKSRTPKAAQDDDEPPF